MEGCLKFRHVCYNRVIKGVIPTHSRNGGPEQGIKVLMWCANSSNHITLYKHVYRIARCIYFTGCEKQGEINYDGERAKLNNMSTSIVLLIKN